VFSRCNILVDLAVTWRETSDKEALAMPGFPSGLAYTEHGRKIPGKQVVGQFDIKDMLVNPSQAC
jgi:hypothetical protein